MAFRRIQKFFSFLCFRANKTISKQDDEPKITKIFFEDPCPAISVNPPVSITSEQAESPFLQKLPLEIRRLIYQHVWADPKKEYNYHHPYGRHVSYIRGRWFSRRCVMYSIDDDLNTIQSEMDAEYDEKKLERLRLCHMRLRSSWGHRHWRCEQRSWRPLHGIDKTGFISLMTVCKRLYPEVVQSIFESHKFMFNDVVSAHEFLVGNTMPLVRHIRNIELTFNMGQYHYQPFLTESTDAVGHQNDVACRPFGNWVGDIWAALEEMTYLHSLRISLDVNDRGVWRKIPEKNITESLRRLRVKHDFTVELPPRLQINAPRLEDQTLSDDDEETAFKIIRRPPLRYWNFVSDRIERFSWEPKVDPISGLESCSIAILKNMTYVPAAQAPYNNPHLD